MSDTELRATFTSFEQSTKEDWALIASQLPVTQAMAGEDRNTRDKFVDSPYYDSTEEFCAEYDQTAFDPEYVSAPLEHYEPLIRKFFVPGT